jgi:hypothetical protein
MSVAGFGRVFGSAEDILEKAAEQFLEKQGNLAHCPSEPAFGGGFCGRWAGGLVRMVVRMMNVSAMRAVDVPGLVMRMVAAGAVCVAESQGWFTGRQGGGDTSPQGGGHDCLSPSFE